MNDLVRLRDGVEWRHVDQEVLALDTVSSTFFSANRAGALLWSALAVARTRAELVDTLVATYEIEPDVARRDVDAFVNALSRHGLLV